MSEGTVDDRRVVAELVGKLVVQLKFQLVFGCQRSLYGTYEVQLLSHVIPVIQ